MAPVLHELQQQPHHLDEAGFSEHGLSYACVCEHCILQPVQHKECGIGTESVG